MRGLIRVALRAELFVHRSDTTRALRQAQSPYRIPALPGYADFASFFRLNCRDASSQPLRPSGAVSSPPHALTRVHVVEERQNTTGIETGETVGASATGMQQLLALLLLLQKHRE